MRREELEHLVAAAATIADEDDFVVIGSQALLGSHPDADGELVVSMELDLYPMRTPDKADMIDGALGDGHGSTRPTVTMRTASARRQR